MGGNGIDVEHELLRAAGDVQLLLPLVVLARLFLLLIILLLPLVVLGILVL